MKGKVRAAYYYDLHEKKKKKSYCCLLVNLHSALFTLFAVLLQIWVLRSMVEQGRLLSHRIVQCWLHPGQQALLPGCLCIQRPVTGVRGVR